MRLEQAAKPGHVLRVSAQLIAASTILHLSSDELEGAVAQEQMENPALEIIEQRICLFCGAPLHGQSCTSCGYSAQLTQPAFTTNENTNDESFTEHQWSDYPHYDLDNYGSAEPEDDEEFDPLARIQMGQKLGGGLQQQLEGIVSAEDASLAEQLVGKLHETGDLRINGEWIS